MTTVIASQSRQTKTSPICFKWYIPDTSATTQLVQYAWMQTQQASPLVVHPRTGSPEGGAAGMNVLGLTVCENRHQMLAHWLFRLMLVASLSQHLSFHLLRHPVLRLISLSKTVWPDVCRSKMKTCNPLRHLVAVMVAQSTGTIILCVTISSALGHCTSQPTISLLSRWWHLVCLLLTA